MSWKEHQERVRQRRRLLASALERALQGQDRIQLEIGSGHGHWLCEYAAAHPDQFCLGIDLIGDRVSRADRKNRRMELDNLRFEKAEALETLESLPRSVRIERTFVLFPDPWPKKRHWKNRLLSSRFLDALAERCDAEARLYFRTDHSGYFEWTSRVVDGHGQWNRAEEGRWPLEFPTVFQEKAESFRSLEIVKRDTATA